MATVVINEKTKIGKNVLAMLKSLAEADISKSIRILDETGYLLSTEANREALEEGLAQFKKGKKGQTLKIDELWK